MNQEKISKIIKPPHSSEASSREKVVLTTSDAVKHSIDNWSDKLKDHESWEKYIGHLWHHVIDQLGIKKNDTVVVVAPGRANKIGHGLAQSGFQGTVYIVEPDNEALSEVKVKYENCLPHCNIIGLAFSLETAGEYLKDKNINSVLSNHPIDDMILSSSLENEEFKKVFQEKYGQDEGYTGKKREELVANKTLLHKAMDSTIHEWESFIKTTQTTSIGISQYKSYYFQNLNIKEPDFYAKLALQELKSRLLLSPQKLSNDISSIDDTNYCDNDRWYIATHKEI